MNQITYVYRGDIEVGTTGKPGYRWSPGYSETINGHVSFPWMQRRECQKDAAKRNSKALFKREP